MARGARIEPNRWRGGQEHGQTDQKVAALPRNAPKRKPCLEPGCGTSPSYAMEDTESATLQPERPAGDDLPRGQPTCRHSGCTVSACFFWRRSRVVSPPPPPQLPFRAGSMISGFFLSLPGVIDIRKNCRFPLRFRILGEVEY